MKTLGNSIQKSNATKTILFSGHDLKFIRGFIAYCRSNPGYRVLVDEHTTHQITNPAKCLALLPSADIVFCEWCLGNAKWYSQRKRADQRLLIRLHHQEMELPYRFELEWKNVDAIIFTNLPHYQRFCREQPEHSRKAVIVYCDVDCDSLGQEKLPGAEFNLGLVGINPMRKRPDLALEVFSKLRQTDSRYTLFFKTRMPWEYKWLWQRPQERDYFGRFFAGIEGSPHCDSIAFHPHGDDMPLWYTQIGFILSTSDHEGSHQAVAEGMAAGCVPIIRDWNGATPLYPDKFVFSSVEQAVALICDFRKSGRYDAITAEARAYAREHFHQTRVFAKLESLFSNGVSAVRQPLPAQKGAASRPVSTPPVMILGYVPAGFRGAYRIRIEQEIKALTQRCGPIHFACLHPGGGKKAEVQLHSTELAKLGGVVHLVPFSGFFDIQLDAARIDGLLSVLGQIVRTHSIRIIHAEALYSARLGLLLKERCPDLALVFDCHGTTPYEEQLSGAHPARIKAMQEVERHVLAQADLNVFVSGAMAEFYLGEHNFAELPHVVLPCCLANERFPTSNMPPAIRLPADKPILAYLGTMAAWQCGEEMIRLMAQLYTRAPEMTFLLLVPQADHAKTRDWLRKYDLPEESFLLAELPHNQVASTLQHAHAGLLLRRPHPVNQVSSPTKFGEYLAAGVPVIMSDGIGDFSNLGAQEGLALILDPKILDLKTYPPEEIARIITFIHQSKEQSQKLATRCRAIARERLHWDDAIDVLIKAYLKLGQTQAPRGVRNLALSPPPQWAREYETSKFETFSPPP